MSQSQQLADAVYWAVFEIMDDTSVQNFDGMDAGRVATAAQDAARNMMLRVLEGEFAPIPRADPKPVTPQVPAPDREGVTS